MRRFIADRGTRPIVIARSRDSATWRSRESPRGRAVSVASLEPCSGAATHEQRYRAPRCVAVSPARLANVGGLRNSPHRLDDTQHGLQATTLPVEATTGLEQSSPETPPLASFAGRLQRAPRPQPTRRLETPRSCDLLKTTRSETSSTAGRDIAASCGVHTVAAKAYKLCEYFGMEES